MDFDKVSFRQKLEDQHQFPGDYLFKFIVPQTKKEAIQEALPVGEMAFRNSSSDKYVSVTMNARVNSSDDVIKVYEKAAKIEGVIAL